MGNLEAAEFPTNPKYDPQTRIPQFPYELPTSPSIPVQMELNDISPCTKEELILAFHKGQRRILSRLLSKQSFPIDTQEAEVESSYLDGLSGTPGGARALAERLGVRFHEE